MATATATATSRRRGAGLRRRRGRHPGLAGPLRGRLPRVPGRRKPDHRRRHGPADKTFPTGDCATCIISPKLVECMRDYNIDVLTMADVTRLEGEAGHFTVEVRKRPRSVDAEQVHRLRRLLAGLPGARTCRRRHRADRSRSEPLDDGRRRQARRNPGPARRRAGRADARAAGDRPAYGYLPRLDAGALACRWNVRVAEILRVASFYDAFRFEPVGRHVDRGLRGHVLPLAAARAPCGAAGKGTGHRARRDRQVGAIHAADGPLPRAVRLVAGHEDRRPELRPGRSRPGAARSWSNSHEPSPFATIA